MEQNKEKDVLMLAIETSCDETAASVVKNGRKVLSNVIYTQIALWWESIISADISVPIISNMKRWSLLLSVWWRQAGIPIW